MHWYEGNDHLIKREIAKLRRCVIEGSHGSVDIVVYMRPQAIHTPRTYATGLHALELPLIGTRISTYISPKATVFILWQFLPDDQSPTHLPPTICKTGHTPDLNSRAFGGLCSRGTSKEQLRQIVAGRQGGLQTWIPAQLIRIIELEVQAHHVPTSFFTVLKT